MAILCTSSALNAQDFKELGEVPEVLSGISGMEITHAGNLWVINDHELPVLYNLDTGSFKTKRVIHLNNEIKDWEDLTTDELGNLYIGDFGNNRNRRRDLKIYKLPNPDSIRDYAYTAEVIRFSLSDQDEFPPPRKNFEYDIEAMVHYRESIYLFSKSRGIPFKGLVKMYRLDDTPGNHTAQLVSKINLGESGTQLENWITSADINEEEGVLLLLSHNKIFVFSCFKEDDFFQGKLNIINLDHFSQKEAICVLNRNKGILISDERTEFISGGKIYFIKFKIDQINCVE